MPKIYEDDIIKAGKDPNAARAWAQSNGVEWVPSGGGALAPTGNFEQGLSALRGSFNPANNARNPFINMDPSIGKPTGMENFMVGAGPAIASAYLGGGLTESALGGIPKLAPYANAIGQGLGNAALEGLNYLTLPQNEKPTAWGAGLRSVAQTAIPLGFNKLGEAVAPLKQKLAPLMSEILPPAKEAMSKLGSSIKDVVAKGLDETTGARLFKDAMLADMEREGIRLPTPPVIDALKQKFVPYAENEMKGLINGLEKASVDGEISLPNFQTLIRAASKQARTPAAKQAFGAFNEEFKNSVAGEIAKYPQGGPQMAQKFIESFNETHSRLKIFEDMNKLVGSKQAINGVKNLIFDDTAKTKLAALDKAVGFKPGEGFLPQIEQMTKQFYAAEKRAAERGATAETNAAILAAQRKARGILYGLGGIAAGAGAKAMGVNSVIGFGGGLGGAEIASWLMSRILGTEGAILPERLAAQGLSATAKAAPALTATANEATREVK